MRIHARKRQRRYGTAVRTRITETVTKTDTDERKRNAGNQALWHESTAAAVPASPCVQRTR